MPYTHTTGGDGWHPVFITRYGDDIDGYEELLVHHEHPEPAEECALTLWLARNENWGALDDLPVGAHQARINEEGELDTMTIDPSSVTIVDIT